MPDYHGPTTPHDINKIWNTPCDRCGKNSRYQWQACANGRRYTALCEECDAALNEHFVHFMNFPNAIELMEWYRQQQAL